MRLDIYLIASTIATTKMRLSTIASAILGATTAKAISTVSVKGNKFFTDDDGKQFFMKGIAYQLTPGLCLLPNGYHNRLQI